jgi:hypothetical protein
MAAVTLNDPYHLMPDDRHQLTCFSPHLTPYRIDLDKEAFVEIAASQG